MTICKYMSCPVNLIFKRFLISLVARHFRYEFARSSELKIFQVRIFIQ